MEERKVKALELSLLLALCIGLCLGLVESGRQQALADKIIRLHVIASGDSAEEQELKMRVKAAVTAELEPIMEEAVSTEAAAELIGRSRERILSAARSAAPGEKIELRFGPETYPTRYAPGIALPAGEYNSLRIIIGEGEGQNWWGIVFPRLMPMPDGAVEVSLLDEDELRLITDDGEIKLSFRILELWEKLRELLE